MFVNNYNPVACSGEGKMDIIKTVISTVSVATVCALGVAVRGKDRDTLMVGMYFGILIVALNAMMWIK